MAAVEDHHVLADRLDVREEVARQEHVAAGRLCDRPHEVEHLRPAARVQAGRGLVEDVQLRVVDHRLRELDLLFHAGRVLRDLSVPFLLDADELKDVVGTAHRGVPVQSADPPHVRDESDPGHVGDQAVVLRHVPDPLPYRHAVPDVASEDLRGPGRGLQQTEEEPEERRLPGPVGSDEPDRAVRDLDREIVHRTDVAEDLRQPGSLNEHHDSLRFRGCPRWADCVAKRVLGFELCGAATRGMPAGGRLLRAQRQSARSESR